MDRLEAAWTWRPADRPPGRSSAPSPGGFGKSLLLDTVKELFEGSEGLFEGLDVHDGWDWSVRHPVVRLDFSSGHFTEPGGLQYEVMAQLVAVGAEADIRSDLTSGPARFRQLITGLRERAGQRVVVLVDEYDKPSSRWWSRPPRARRWRS